MKHTKLFKNIALGIACTLGLGAAIGAGTGLFNQNSFEFKEAKADEDVLYIAGSANNLITGAAPTGVTVTSSSSSYTLTLNNYQYQGTGYIGPYDVYCGLYYKGDKDLYIVLDGTNSINVNSAGSWSGGYTYGMYLENSGNKRKVVVKGDGQLTIRNYPKTPSQYGPTSYGLYIKNHFYLEEENGTTSPKLYIHAANGGTGSVSCYSGGFFSYIGYNTTINNGTLEAYGGSSSQLSFGFQGYNGFTMNGGTVKFVGGTASGEANSFGFYAENSTFNGGQASFIGGSATGTGKSYGAFGYEEQTDVLMTVNNGTESVTIIGEDAAIHDRYVKNNLKASAWTNTSGTGDPDTIAKSSKQLIDEQYKKVVFEVKPSVITLNNDGASTAGTAKIYENEDNFYLDAACTNKMTTSANPITPPTKTGYTFDGYYYNNTQYIDSNGYIVSGVTHFYEDKTLTARWTAHTTTISFDNQISGVPATNPVEATYGQSLPSVTPPSKNGYTFIGYGTTEYPEAGSVQYYNSNGVGLSVWDRDVEEYTLYAWWSAKQYTITVDPNGGTVTPTSWTYYTNNQELFPFAQGYSQNTPTRTGYTFVCWETDYQGTYMDGNVLRLPGDTYGDFTITAKWTPKTSALTFDLQGGSGTAPTDLIATYDADMPTYGEAIPTKEGCSFDGFYDQENGEGTKYYNADLSSAHKWDKNKTTGTPLYAFYTKDMAYEVIGYDGDYTRTAKSVTVNMTDPDSTAYVKFSNDGGLTYTVDYDDRSTFTDVGEYDVYYQISATIGGVKYTTVTAVEHISIKRVDRTQLENLIDEATDFYNEIKDAYPNIANVLKTTAHGIDDSNDFNAEDNLLPEEVEFERVQLEAVFNQARAEVALVKINDIQPLACTDQCKALIDDALNYYNGLSAVQKEIVGDAAYQELVHDLEVYTHVKNFYNLVEAIDEPTNTQAYKDQIDAARSAHNALTDSEEKLLVDASILAVLVTNEDIYNYFSKVNDVANATTYNDYVSKVSTARSTYDALSMEAKAMISETDYQVLLNEEKAKETIDSIHNIGTVEYTAESKTKIDAARTSYDSLTEAQKAFVNNVNYQELVDAEHVYIAMDVIENIGDVGYDYESNERITQAREYYDSLTDQQKDMLGEVYYSRLVAAENSYQSLETGGNILVIILLILACLLLLGGFFFIFLVLKRRKDDDNEDDSNPSNGNHKNKTVKAMSVSALPLILAASGSHYLDSPYIALYIIGGLALLAWITGVILLFVFKQKVKDLLKEAKNLFKKKPSKSATKAEANANNVVSNDDDEEVVTITDEKGNRFQIRFIKSFTAKLIQASDETKAYYTELKNEVLSYKKTNSRVSWHFDSINAGRTYVIKFGMRGKTLCVYYPLNADDYADSKYKVEKAEAKKYADVPCLYRINNDRRLNYAKELIAVVAAKLGLEKGEVASVNYYLPYEERDPLLARGLIKELKVSLDEPKIVEAASRDEDEVIRVVENGVAFEIRFSRSYTAKLIQASDEAKSYYQELKNYILGYKGVSNRTSWHYESFNKGRDQLIKFGIKGKTLCLYYALDVKEYNDSKYLIEEVSSKKYEEVPCLYRIKNPRRCSYAKELVDAVMAKYGLVKGEEAHEKYNLPYEDRDSLLARGLIKEVKTKAKVEAPRATHPISVSEADASMTDEVAQSHIKEDLLSKRHYGKKAIINIDTIGEKYEDNEEVTLESLIEKKLVPANTGYVKVLARGSLNKKLHVDLQEYSIQAVKMILLEGGTVKKAK